MLNPLVLSAALAFAAPASAPEKPSYVTLPPGRYSVRLKGLVCTVCGRAIAAEWMKLPEVEKATVDFDMEQATLWVRIDRHLKVAALRKKLRPAAKLADMGTRYEIGEIVYLP